MNRIWAIGRNTLTEVMRMPAYAIVLAVGVCLIALSPWFTMFSLGHNTKIVKEMGLATVQLAGLLIAALSASASVSREIESRTATTVLSKPVGRIEFILGKYAGLVMALGVAFFVLTVVLLLAGRHGTLDTVRETYDWPIVVLGVLALVLVLTMGFVGNYFLGWHFGATCVWTAVPLFGLTIFAVSFVDKNWHAQPFGARMDAQLVIGAVLILFAIMVITAVALAASTRLKVVGTLLVCVLVLMAGLLSDYFFKQAAVRPGVAGWAAWIAHALLPNFQHFWVGDAIIGERTVPLGYPLMALAYAALYSVGALAFALMLFQERELA
ncbi:MAG: ABC transporter permease subunit [Verrucomicrobia bacterium]|nr:ABC transporter permease subunit [Verrucomicrobiota bacterium]